MGQPFPCFSAAARVCYQDVSHAWILARATYGWVVRAPVYYVLLAAFGLLILVSPIFPLFEFHREQAAIREMGMGSLTLWGFLVLLSVSGPIITQELEDRTALTLLSKPLSRSGFLLGKYLGILMGLAPGLLVLGLLLLLTFWWNFGREGMATLRFRLDLAAGRISVGDYIAEFLLRDGLLIVQGTLLSFLQSALLGGLIVAAAAFFPLPVSITASVFIYILGNMTGYIRGAGEASGSAVLEWGARLMYYLLPNLGYLNLQHAYGQGDPIRGAYLLLALAYTALYVGCVLGAACWLFGRREIR
jgi:ABC-type transport system involved in multi-copper enzyme maturation permease subunit